MQWGSPSSSTGIWELNHLLYTEPLYTDGYCVESKAIKGHTAVGSKIRCTIPINGKASKCVA